MPLSTQHSTQLSTQLSTQRKSIYPEADDTWETVAVRELSELDPEQGIGNLQSWNLHVFMRPAAPDDSPRAGNPILPSDIIFLEAPIKAG
jgi:hypothetical protein